MATQSIVIETARRDLVVLGLTPVVPVQLDHDWEYTDGSLGVCQFEVDSEPEIWVSPDLHGSALYRVVLHELGHTFGLEHTRRHGIMFHKRYCAADRDMAWPTKAQRKRWSAELAQLVLTHRLKGF